MSNPKQKQGKVTSFFSKKPNEDLTRGIQSNSNNGPHTPQPTIAIEANESDISEVSITTENLASSMPSKQVNSESEDSEGEEEDGSDESENQMDTSQTSASPSVPKRKKKEVRLPVKKKSCYKQNFVNGWLDIPEFSDWLEKRFHRTRNCYVAYCKVCSEFKTNGKSELLKHCKTPRHIRFQKLLSDNTDLRERMNTHVRAVPDNKVITMEVRLLLFIAEHDLSLSLMDSLLHLLRSCFPLDDTLKQVLMGKQKGSNIIRFGLGTHFATELSTTLRSVFFSVIMDETTDITVEKKLAVMVEFYDVVKGKTVVELLDLITCEDGKSQTLVDNLLQLFERRKIPLDNLVGFSGDTCNTMFGVHASVTALLKRKCPHLLAVKCSCHMSHLCTSYACKSLPPILEKSVKWMYNHFARSSNRKKAFAEFQLFTQVAPHAILKPSDTRWLSLEAAVDRILEMYPALQLYFTDVVSDLNESDDENKSIEILEVLNSPTTKPYFEFLSHALHCVNEFNTAFQAESPLLYTLRERVSDLIQDFANNFMETSHVRDTDPLLLDPSMDEYYLDDENIYLGILAEESMAASDLSAQQKREIRLNCRKFYISAINQFQARFDFRDLYFDLCKIVKPEVARKADPKLISCLFERFPILKKSVRESVAQREWRQAALLKKEFFNAENERDVIDMPVEAYWKIVLNAEKNSKKCTQILLFVCNCSFLCPVAMHLAKGLLVS